MEILSLLKIIVPSLIGMFIILWILSLRRIVPTNVVHIVQRGKNTTSYGVGKGSNVYYKFPTWVPKLGVEVRELPVSNFEIALDEYSAYDQDRVPFVVDVMAFMRIDDTNVAATRVSSFRELAEQLTFIVQGAVRSILAKSKLEEIMEERPKFSEMFTNAVSEDLKGWGVSHVKGIELMDVRDEKGTTVIHSIMAKRISGIDMESRTEVAANNKTAEQAELEARKEVALTAAETEQVAGEAQARSRQAIGIADAESTKKTGIANEQAKADIAKAEVLAKEEEMSVIKVAEVRQADIDKERAIVNAEQFKKEVEIAAEADKFKVEMDADAALNAKLKDAQAVKEFGVAEADVIQAKGEASADAEKLSGLANVTPQITLAKEIGENANYQSYLIKIKDIEISGDVQKVQYEALAEALNGADLKLLVNSGDVHSGLGKFSDILSSKGASSVNGLIEALKQTPQGSKILSLVDSIPGVTAETPNTPNTPSSEKKKKK